MSPLAAHAEEFIKAAIEDGQPVPAELIAPELPQEFGEAYIAARMLESDAGFFPVHRIVDGHLTVSNERGAIPFAAIDAYAKRFGIDSPDEFERLIHLIRVIESVQRGQ